MSVPLDHLFVVVQYVHAVYMYSLFCSWFLLLISSLASHSELILSSNLMQMYFSFLGTVFSLISNSSTTCQYFNFSLPYQFMSPRILPLDFHLIHLPDSSYFCRKHMHVYSHWPSSIHQFLMQERAQSCRENSTLLALNEHLHYEIWSMIHHEEDRQLSSLKKGHASWFVMLHSCCVL